MIDAILDFLLSCSNAGIAATVFRYTDASNKYDPQGDTMSGETFDIRAELKSRIIEPFEKEIRCDTGWDDLLKNMHNELIEADPHYTLCQVKEKFGGLRVYYNPSNPNLNQTLRDIVSKYENSSLHVCEKTGQTGSLKKRGFCFKTLNDSFIADGWKIVQEDSR